VTVFFTKDTAGPKVDLLLYLPANVRGPVPTPAERELQCEREYHRRSWHQARE
jgi:hypothetical protein